MSPFVTLAGLILSCAILVPLEARPRETFATAAVSSQVAKDYKRKRNSDGSFPEEYYALSLGGQVQGTTSDKSMEGMSTTHFSKLLQEHLAEQNYILAPDSRSAELLLYVTWGRTIPGSDQSAAKHFDGDIGIAMTMTSWRDASNVSNARLLGYVDALNRANDIARWAGGGTHYDDLISDLTEPRYYILIAAYDFRRLVNEEEAKLLWVTRISISAVDYRFDRNAAAMIARASLYAGKDSRGLIRRFEGRVEIGELEVLGVDDAPAESAAPNPAPP